MVEKNAEDGSDGVISPREAMSIALGTTIGGGNIGGVATAIAVGGPGAIFWMWVAGVLGQIIKMAEITLAVHYRSRNKDGSAYGGPNYYMQKGIGRQKGMKKAFKILRAKLYDIELEKSQKAMAQERKSQVGTGDRSERIRTYNYPQGRVSDHRINMTLYKLEQFVNGDMDEMIDALITTDQTDKMQSI